MIELGSLVQSQNNDLGIGKVTRISDDDAIVEYFCSVGQRLEKTLPLNSLSKVRLQAQTRCYINLGTQDTWIIGRVFDWDEDRRKYQIDLPDKKTAIAIEQEIYVRCNLPIVDPIETLAMKGQETPYFHDRRLAFVKCLIKQRAVSRGMTGLISANINLYPHQVEVVRRVLEDPIQRYLLADEVGLGKTIEAGVILRQYLLDEPKKRAVVLVPQHLLQQWRIELENKFYLSHFPERVVVLPVDDIHRINPKAKVGLLILDEAHHIAAMATSKDAAVRQRFETYKNLAHRSDRLLLLSATPVLNHEQDFLAMLHLLDPTTYKLEDLAGFRARVESRQEIGKVLLCFREGANPSVLQTNLQQLQNLFAEDQYLLNLTQELQNCLQTSETLSTERDKIVREIRTHISDTYRLHRRMLRNRRASVEDVIFDRNVTLKEEYDLDERSPDIYELIEKWRTTAPNEESYRRIFLLLFLTSGTWLGILEQVITARLSSIRHSGLIREFGEDDIHILTTTPKFPEEAEILESLLGIIRQPSEDGDRIELLTIILLYRLSEILGLQSFRSNIKQLCERVKQRIKRPVPGDYLPKIVIFTGFEQTCAEIIRSLSDTFGAGTIASHKSEQTPAQVESNLNQFKSNPNCFILVCDASGEEGRNFQFVDWMIHFDLPWSPNRLEQRIGRIDRIGRPINVEFTVLVGADIGDSPHDAWYQLLKNGLRIFNQSIASLQFYVDAKLAELEATLFESSASGMSETIEKIQLEIAEEQVKISEQNALDEIDTQEEGATQYFQELDNYDARHLEIKRAVEGWVEDALHFQAFENSNLAEAWRYQPNKRTLLPVDELRSRFANHTEQFGTYNRRVANQSSDIKLFRIGEGLVEALFSYIDWDDRGRAFALWRTDQSWDSGEGMEWFGFRFNYVVEANLEIARQVLTKAKLDDTKFKILKRRTDALFPPIVETIFIDARNEPMCVVEDENLLNILQLPYKDRSNNQYWDYNLAKGRLKIIDDFVDASKWQNFCYQARSTSLELLSKRLDFINLCEQRAKVAEKKLANRSEQLRLRLNRQTWDYAVAEELNVESGLNEAILEGIRQPQIQLDSVGFIILSGRSPVQSE
ncbi:protein DpdE [aff. Roholtiella sp. LEGE 12411]|uniref:protein DpdE n=1 Tax=aff. Roholtiella sp. LEGE 12411 TaxID=1828822 RepID=UPI00187E55F9|nr:protein DpdE [aff. Roholtiella sp. LEGE 12411]MBE9035019.1 helicase [aff. Roholtiella sp. LEGE 12411]